MKLVKDVALLLLFVLLEITGMIIGRQCWSVWNGFLSEVVQFMRILCKESDSFCLRPPIVIPNLATCINFGSDVHDAESVERIGLQMCIQLCGTGLDKSSMEYPGIFY